MTDRYTYDAWGSLLSHDALSDDQFTGSVRQPYQYVGQLGYYTHFERPDFKLLQLGMRFYDPETGRFTQRDPVRVVAGSYVYSDAQPTVMVDPSGAITIPFCGLKTCHVWAAKSNAVIDYYDAQTGKYIRTKKDNLRISLQTEHPFRLKPNTDFSFIRTPNSVISNAHFGMDG